MGCVSGENVRMLFFASISADGHDSKNALELRVENRKKMLLVEHLFSILITFDM